MPAEALQNLDELRPLLLARRFGVLTDVDGTISPLALRPDAAYVSPLARDALAALNRHLPVVGAISGRELHNLRAMVGLPDLLYIGSHGLSWWYEGRQETPEELLPYIEWEREALAELASLQTIPGVRFEDKVFGLAIHYREAEDRDTAHQAILNALVHSAAARRFEVREAIRVVELHPNAGMNKGTALRRVVERFDLDGLLYLGDDLTDVDAMQALAALRAEHGIRAASIAVRHSQAPPLALQVADYAVEEVAGAERVLDWLVRAVQRTEHDPVPEAAGQ